MSTTLSRYPSLGVWFDRDAEKWFDVVRVDGHLFLEGTGETFWLNPENGQLQDVERDNYEDQLRDLVTGDFETDRDYDELGNVIWTYLTETGEAELDRKAKGDARQVAEWLTDPQYDGLTAIWKRGA
jgi:hypothetical protein